MRRVRCLIGVLLAALCVAPLQAQQGTGTIRGKITDDSTKQPIPGVTVTFGGRTALSQTDGQYFLGNVPAGTDTLQARIIGYAPVVRTVTVAPGQTVNIDLTMSSQAVGLSQIVVVGYGQQRAGAVTGAIKQVNADQFNQGPIVRPEDLIQAKVAGVQVSDNNAPGGGLSVRIRGQTSVNASSEPIYVVDGVPLAPGGGLSAGGDPLSFLNPNDIKSMTVLKDAASASIYGANAANGVVLIQTKSGSGAPHITYSGSAFASSVTKSPDLLTAAQFRTAAQQYAPARADSLGSANTDWYSVLERTGYGQEHNVAVAGAGDNNDYRVSFGYFKQDGIIRNSSNERLSLGVNFDQRLFDDALDLRANATGARIRDHFLPGSVLGNAAGMAPTQPIYDPTSPTGFWDWQTSGASASNPLAEDSLQVDQGTTWRSVGNVQAEYRFPFAQGFKAHVNLGYDVAKADRSQFGPNNLASQMRQGHGYVTLNNNTETSSLLETYLNYTGSVGGLPGTIDLTGGYSYSAFHGTYNSFSEADISSNLLGINGIPTVNSDTRQPNLNVVDSKLISFFGRLNYNIKDRYLASFGLRRDGSSRFGPSNAWGVFPAVSLGWRVSDESFLRGFSALSDLKLRASWGKTGNQAFANYQQYPVYVYSNQQAQYQFGNQFITTIRPNAVDPNIKWEQTTATDFGFDWGLFGQRLSGSFDWYRKNTDDLIFTVPVPAGTNYSNYLTTNIGSMRNQGVELSLDAQLLQGGEHALGWLANFTASHNNNELLSITTAGSQVIQTGNVSGGVGTTIQVLEPGVPVNSFYVCPQVYDASGNPTEGMFYDTTGAAVNSCTSSGLRPYHNPQPNWIFGHSSYMTLGRFDLSFTLRAYLGNYVYNNVASQGAYQTLTNGGSASNTSASVLKTGFVVPQYLSDYFVEDASFLRMDNITLGYAFKFDGQPARLYASVKNAFTISGYTGVDPTAGINGIDNNIYPRSRTVTGGLSVQF